MSTVPAGQLLKIWEFRLREHNGGPHKWADQTRAEVERLVTRLRELGPNEEIKIDAEESRDPLARFIRGATGEVLAELRSLASPACEESHTEPARDPQT
jgi:hypothetical protein